MTRAEREKRAQHTVYKTIPEILRSSPRAKHGVSQADLIVDPEPMIKTPTGPTAPVSRPDLKIRITNADTLEAASRVSERPYASKRNTGDRRTLDTRPTVTVHNMGSLTRRGGGFLTGSNSQEEFLCARTTLYASLFDQFYALPDIGGIFTPDVLVFRDLNAIDLSRRERFYINVITAGVPRHPETRGRYDEREVSCTCGVSYCDRDRDIMIRKMKAVLRMAQMKGTKQLILGAWGCGGLNHPVKEVAKLWRKVIAGSQRQRKPNAEQWEGIDEVVFAIPNPSHAKEFRHVFEDVLAPDYPSHSPSSTSTGAGAVRESAELERLIATAGSLELQIDTAQSSFLKGQLREELRAVNHEIALGRAARSTREDEANATDEDVEDDYVVSGYAGSDGEGDFYPVGADSGSESDGAGSGAYEFRFGQPQSGDPHTSQDEDELSESTSWVGYSPSPQFDPQTGWFQGSIDELSAHVLGQGRIRGSVSPRSPLNKLEPGEDESSVVDGFLAKFERPRDAVYC